MRIEHVALWTSDLERARRFYMEHFAGESGPRYENPAKGFSSYFLTFESGARLELMQARDLAGPVASRRVGLAHFAISVGSVEAVIAKTEALRSAGVCVVGEPRRTGDGYFESVVEDPDGNPVEITA